MRTIAYSHAAGVGLAAVALITVGCSSGKSVDASPPPRAGVSAASTPSTPAQPTEVKLIGESGVEVTLTGPIAVKYSSATKEQREALGKPLTGDRNAGKRESGVVFQQFQGGVSPPRTTRPERPHISPWARSGRPGISHAARTVRLRSPAPTVRQARWAFPSATRTPSAICSCRTSNTARSNTTRRPARST